MRRILSRRTMPDTQPIKDYLCVEFPSGGSLNLQGTKPTTMDYVAFSKDGRNWTKYTSDGSMSASAGEKIYVKGSGSAMGVSGGYSGWRLYISPNNWTIVNNRANISGNIMSLLYDDDFEDKLSVGDSAFSWLFSHQHNTVNIKDASGLRLPATAVGKYAYKYMFGADTVSTHNTTYVFKAPELPAMNLDIACYESMFKNIKGLTEMPYLPAIVVKSNCYKNMFDGCSIKEAKVLPATTLATYCYSNMFANQHSDSMYLPHNMLPATIMDTFCYYQMFWNCAGIKTIPSDLLPATTLNTSCYEEMFRGCVALEYIPDRLLPATTLSSSCYKHMFQSCTAVTVIPRNLLPATTLAESCYYGMFAGSSNSFGKMANGVNVVRIPYGLLHATTLAYNCYGYMFAGCASLTQIASPIVVNDTQLAYNCFGNMFDSCTALVSVDKHLIPTSNLAVTCYQAMFKNCDHLTNTIEFTDGIAQSCYQSMYEGCTALTDFEDLPATTLADSCYKAMFKGTGITTLEDKYLPADIGTTGQYAYQSMFEGCESLTDVPADFIRATTFRSGGCCQAMFKGCKKLSVAPYLNPTDLIAAPSAFQEMFMACYEEKTVEGETVYTGLTRMAYLPGESHSKIPFTNAQILAFNQMFNGCMALEEVPTIDTTVAGDSALKSMFMSCKSITDLPILYIRTAGTNTCESMFQGCYSLTEIPNGFLHNVIVGGTNYRADGWAASMFRNCTALEDVPSDLFDGQNLYNNCFASMFENCISLETAPNLPIVSSTVGGAY